MKMTVYVVDCVANIDNPEAFTLQKINSNNISFYSHIFISSYKNSLHLFGLFHNHFNEGFF